MTEWKRCPCCGAVRRVEPKKLATDLPPWEDRDTMLDGTDSLSWAMLLETLRRDGSV